MSTTQPNITTLAPTAVRVPIEELRTGDLVLTHGMVVEITGPNRASDLDRDLVSLPGIVRNADAIRNEGGTGFRWPYSGLIEEDLAWTIQSIRGLEWSIAPR